VAETPKQKPAVPVRSSVKPDYIVSLETEKDEDAQAVSHDQLRQ